jgi:hypothetical protein
MLAALQQVISSAPLCSLSPQLTMLASVLSVFLCATSALASVARVSQPSNPSGLSRCSTTISDEKLAAAEKHFTANKGSRSLVERAPGSAVLNVYFHVISADGTQAGGNILFVQLSLDIQSAPCSLGYRQSVILTQMQVLNNDFANSGLSFNLANVDRTVNDDWFNNAAPNSPQQSAMKRALRQGGRADLNIYSVG